MSYLMQSPLARTLFLGVALAACSAGPASEAESKGSSTSPFVTTPVGTFDAPFTIAFLPDGSALVTEKAGHLKHWRQGQPNAEVAGVPAVKAGGQGGLLDVALSPGFASDRQVYLTYSEPSANGGAGLAMARGTLAEADGRMQLSGVRVLWHDPQGGKGGQYGGVIVFAPDGQSLYLSSGAKTMTRRRMRASRSAKFFT
jgi:glucose/arabinose dehydrogenase